MNPGGGNGDPYPGGWVTRERGQLSGPQGRFRGQDGSGRRSLSPWPYLAAGAAHRAQGAEEDGQQRHEQEAAVGQRDALGRVGRPRRAVGWSASRGAAVVRVADSRIHGEAALGLRLQLRPSQHERRWRRGTAGKATFP